MAFPGLQRPLRHVPDVVLSASEDDRATFHELAARAMMDVWDRRTGKTVAG